MNISFNTISAYSFNLFQEKLHGGLTPVQKKVALIATACFALIVLSFIIYGCCWQRLTHILTTTHNDDNDDNNNGSNQNVNGQSPVTADLDEVNDLPADPAAIICYNREQIRQHIIEGFQAETMNPNGQWRILYLDTKGRLQGIKGPDAPLVWLNGKIQQDDPSLIKVDIAVQRHYWDPKTQLAFDWDAPSYHSQLPKEISDIMRLTMNELNQLAQGAYQMSKGKDQDKLLFGNCWESYFSQVKDYPSSVLMKYAA